MGRRSGLKPESGTCNVCSAPCSSCMHFDLGSVDSKFSDLSDEICDGTAASQCSIADYDAGCSSRVKAQASSRSEASNLVNVSSSHEVLSENAESRVIVPYDASEDSEDVATRPTMSWAAALVEDQVPVPPNCVSDRRNFAKDESDRSFQGYGDKNLGDGKTNQLHGDKHDKNFDGKKLSDSLARVSESVSRENQGSKNSESRDAPSKELKSEAVGNTLSNRENVKSPPRSEANEIYEAESNKESGRSSDGYLLKNETRTSGEIVQEAHSADTSGNETDDSEIAEQDVKVCDICGDAGREDLLAICSRCTDGAEHTYCMQDMVEEVPEGEWLCEECKVAEETENQKQEASEAKGKSSLEVHSDAQGSRKRRAENVEEVLDAKRQAIESRTESSKLSSSTKVAALSQNSSFKSLDRGKSKPASQTLFSKRSNENVDSTQSTASLVQSPKDFLPRRKEEKDKASLDLKEGSSKAVGKSASFKSAYAGSSYGIDSKVKMLPSQISRPQEIKGPKQVKDWNGVETLVSSAGKSSTNGICSSGEQTRSSLLSGSKGLTSQKEDHAAEKGPSDALSVKKNVVEEMSKGNRLRAAVDAALLKKPTFCKNRGLGQPEGSFGSHRQMSSDKISQSQSTVSKMIKNPVSYEVTQGGRLDLTTAAVAAVPHKQTITPSHDLRFPPSPGELGINVHSWKPTVRDWPLPAASILPKASALPEHEYIWQGGLEVQRGGKPWELHNGIQAHLSTLASSKVLEMVNRFPERVPLNEVHRLSAWPGQFHKTGAKEDHIALFFFAKDFESYETIYKPLVDNMIRKDLALKGNLDGVELLIFASNQLPLNCQRWNMLFFLWGVFRGRKQGCSNPPKISNVRTVDALPQEIELLNVLHKNKESSVSESLSNIDAATENQGRTDLVADRDLNNKESSNNKSSISLESKSKASELPSRVVASSLPTTHKDEHGCLEHAIGTRPAGLQGIITTDCGPSNDQKQSLVVLGDRSSSKVHLTDDKKVSLIVGAKDDKASGSEDPITDVRTPQSIDNGITMDRVLNNSGNHRKRQYLDLTEPPAEDPPDFEEKIPLRDMNKKRRTDSGAEGSCTSSGNGFELEKTNPESGDETVGLKNSEKTKRYLFSLDLNQSNEAESGDEELQDVVPNLELAPGAGETPRSSGIPSFLTGKLKEQHSEIGYRNGDKETGEVKEEEDVASLSLSLSFPFPKK